MIYRTLDTMPLRRFRELYLGDDRAASTEPGRDDRRETESAARRLRMEYARIVGGRQVVSRVARRDDALRLEMRRRAMTMALAVLRMGDAVGAAAVLADLGYRVNAGDAKAVEAKLKALERADAYREDKILRAIEEEEARALKPTRETMTREKVALMEHVKMYIDEDRFTAAEYAWMLRRMADDIEESMRRIREKKRKRKK